MPKHYNVCRVCGAKYEACYDTVNKDGIFRWREVACSPACGEKYLQAVLASRAKAKSVQGEEPHNE